MNEAQSERFKLVARGACPEGRPVSVGEVQVGGRAFVVAAGPCAVEGADQVGRAAEVVASAGAVVLRGGAFKPRTSPYAFQGLGIDGLRLLQTAGDAVGLPVVTEVMAPEDVDVVARHAAMLQVGARNMQNFPLLKALGGAGKPVLLKRGFGSTLEELLLAAEYVVVHGNPDVVLCERGIRTFETATRNTLDLGGVAALKRMTHLPVLVDPSHGTGRRELVIPLSLAAAAAGADGILVEVHPQADAAKCDGSQSLSPEEFSRLMTNLASLTALMARPLHEPPPGARIRPSVQSHRDRIDAIDAALMRLLQERVRLARDLGDAKRAAGQPIRAPRRETNVLSHIRSLADEPLSAASAERVFRAVIAASLDAQERPG